MRLSRALAFVAALATLTMGTSLNAGPVVWTAPNLMDHLVKNTGALYEQVRLFVREQHALYQTQIIPHQIEQWRWIQFDPKGRVVPTRTAYLGKPFFDGVWRNDRGAPVALQPRLPDYIKQETVRRFYDLHEASKYLANLYNGKMIHPAGPFGPMPRDGRVNTGQVVAAILNSMGLPSPRPELLAKQNGENWNLAWFVTDSSYQNTYAILSVIHAAVYQLLRIRNAPYVYGAPGADMANYVLGYRLSAIAHYHNNIRYIMDQILHYERLNVGSFNRTCFAQQYPVFSFHFNRAAATPYTGDILMYPVFPLAPGAAVPAFAGWGRGGPHGAHVELNYNVESWQAPAPGVTLPNPMERGYTPAPMERAPRAGNVQSDPWFRPMSPGDATPAPRGEERRPGFGGPVPRDWGTDREFTPSTPGTLTPPSDPADVGPAPRRGEYELPPGSDSVDPEPLPPIPSTDRRSPGPGPTTGGPGPTTGGPGPTTGGPRPTTGGPGPTTTGGPRPMAPIRR